MYDTPTPYAAPDATELNDAARAQRDGLPSLHLPPAPFRRGGPFGIAAEPVERAAVTGGGPAPAPSPAPAPAHAPSPAPAPSQVHADRTIARPEFEQNDALANDRRSEGRSTPDRRTQPRMYASPWMAQPQAGALDPRPLRLPHEMQQEIRALDTRMPQIPGIATKPQSPPAQEHLAQPTYEYEVTVEAPEQPPNAPQGEPVTFNPDDWFPAEQPTTTAAPGDAQPMDHLGAIFAAPQPHPQSHPQQPVPMQPMAPPAAVQSVQIVNPGMPAVAQSAAARPDVWFAGTQATAPIHDSRSGVSALLYIVLPALAGIGAGLLAVHYDLQRYLSF